MTKSRKIFRCLPLVFLCLFLAGCGKTVFTVRMTEFYAAADPVDVTVSIGGSTCGDLLFTVNETDYRVRHAPTVSEPYFELLTEVDDRMNSVILTLNADEASRSAELEMIPTDGGASCTYCTAIEDFQPLLDWLAQN